MADVRDLGQRWVELVGSSPEAAEVGDDLIARWDESHRRYHTLDHLQAVLDHLERFSGPPAVRLAAWYHDAVYRPERADNERASAELAASTLPRLGADPEEVVRLVLLTAGHSPGPSDEAGAALCDADLAVLASTPDRYESYRRAVREEYRFLDDPSWVAGRTRFLQTLLARPRIYATSFGRDRWEEAARRNLGQELSFLAPA
jgi:predicted metal-dependent HD superfamily phosphohydrolase